MGTAVKVAELAEGGVDGFLHTFTAILDGFTNVLWEASELLRFHWFAIGTEWGGQESHLGRIDGESEGLRGVLQDFYGAGPGLDEGRQNLLGTTFVGLG